MSQLTTSDLDKDENGDLMGQLVTDATGEAKQWSICCHPKEQVCRPAGTDGIQQAGLGRRGPPSVRPRSPSRSTGSAWRALSGNRTLAPGQGSAA